MTSGKIYVSQGECPALDELYTVLRGGHNTFIAPPALRMAFQGLYHNQELRRLFRMYQFISHRHLALAYMEGKGVYHITDRLQRNVSIHKQVLLAMRSEAGGIEGELHRSHVELALQAEAELCRKEKFTPPAASAALLDFICERLHDRLGQRLELSVANVEEIVARIEAAQLVYLMAN